MSISTWKHHLPVPRRYSSLPVLSKKTQSTNGYRVQTQIQTVIHHCATASRFILIWIITIILENCRDYHTYQDLCKVYASFYLRYISSNHKNIRNFNTFTSKEYSGISSVDILHAIVDRIAMQIMEIASLEYLSNFSRNQASFMVENVLFVSLE